LAKLKSGQGQHRKSCNRGDRVGLPGKLFRHGWRKRSVQGWIHSDSRGALPDPRLHQTISIGTISNYGEQSAAPQTQRAPRAPFTPNTRQLHPQRRLRRRPSPRIPAHMPKPHGRNHPLRPRLIPGKQMGRKPVIRIIGRSQDLILRLETHHRNKGPERLLIAADRVGRHTRNQRRRIEQAAGLRQGIRMGTRLEGRPLSSASFTCRRTLSKPA